MRLTKKVALAANDDIQGKIGFKPALDTKLTADKLYKELYQKVLDVEIDDDDREDLEDATCEVIDALAAKFPDMKGDEPVVEDAKVVDEKPAKKEKKSKKVKAEKPAKEKKAKGKKEVEAKEEAPVPVPEKKSKKAKGKKGKVDPLALAEEIKTDKKIKRDGLYDIVNANTDLFGNYTETLLTITNPMVLKKQMRNVLEGGKVEMTKTKAPVRKPKKVEPTLRENVEAADDLKVLKGIAKANKESFPGVKAKKFDKLKKLQKAMLAVIVEKKRKGKTAGADMKTIRAERQKRIDWITAFINDAGGSVGRKKLTAKAIEEFPNPAKAIRDLISYAKNPNYNKFDKLMVEVDGVIGWEGKVKAAKKSKAKAKEEAPAPEPTKKEKKGKKDKKNKKNKKSKK